MLHTLDPVPGPAHGRTGRAHLGAVGDTRRQGVLRQLRQRGQRHRPAAVLHGPAVQPDPGAALQLPRPVLRQHGGHRAAELVVRRASRRSTSATSTAATGIAARSATCPTTSTSPPASADLQDVIRTATAGDVACLIAEPIQGVGGLHRAAGRPASAPCKEVLDEHGILFVSDEVQTGWGRTGEHFWGYQAHGITPDLLTFAKGLGNGLAIGGVAGRADLIDAVHANSISTFGGQPAGHRRRPGQPRLSVVPRPAGQRPGARQAAHGPARARWPRSWRWSARSGAGA